MHFPAGKHSDKYVYQNNEIYIHIYAFLCICYIKTFHLEHASIVIIVFVLHEIKKNPTTGSYQINAKSAE